MFLTKEGFSFLEHFRGGLKEPTAKRIQTYKRLMLMLLVNDGDRVSGESEVEIYTAH